MRRNQYLKALPTAVLLLLVLFVGAVALFGVVVHEVILEEENQADNYVLLFVSQHLVSPRVTVFMKGVTYFASANFLQIAYGILIAVYLVKKEWKRSAEIAAIGISGFIISYFMKLSFERLRPPDPLIEGLRNFSFPSGHATSGFIFYGLLAYIAWKSGISRRYKFFVATSLILFSLLIGFSRIYLRVHYPSDVIAGFCIGYSWLLLTCLLFEYLQRKRMKRKENVN
ncbi:MAG: phosphatase PAP2 family protein [Bacteroidota bacterium]